MLFNSLQFLVFFPTVVGLHFALPHRFRWALLLVASYVFYMAWEPGYAVLIATSTLVDYIAGIRMGRTPALQRRRGYLLFSLCTNLGLLFFFKYYNFFGDTLRPLLALAGWEVYLPHSRFLLPVGISFYTFQTLSYTIEVYRGNQAPERHLGRFALYVAFFPQLVAGPIERAQNLLPQLRTGHDFDYARVTDGLKLMLWGLFKKVVVADRLAFAIEHVYGAPEGQPGPVLCLATLFFAFQIYCDFSGYTDIAIGAAQVLGVRLMENFRQPYFAVSIADFWRRWHISLSSWFRDYLYIALGGNRVTVPRWCWNIAVVFLLSGLWHGANWTFVIWGLLHGSFLIVGRFTGGLRGRVAAACGLEKTPRLTQGLQVLMTFGLVCFAWIFFRADSLRDALYVAGHLPTGWGVLFDGASFPSSEGALGMLPRELLLSLLLIAWVIGVDAMQARGPLRPYLARQPLWLRWGVYAAGLWGIFLFGVLRQTEFYYFVF